MQELRIALTGFLEDAEDLLWSYIEDAGLQEYFTDAIGIATPEGYSGDRPVSTYFGLCLQKAEVHVTAVLRANESRNYHSMGAHARVIIECAAEVVAMARACDKVPKALDQVNNNFEHDLQWLWPRMVGGWVRPNETSATTTTARKATEQSTRVTFTGRASALDGGSSWYRFLSNHFCKANPNTLQGPPYFGGMLPAPEWEVDCARALVLDCVLSMVCQMLTGYGYVTMTADDDQLFIKAVEFSNKKEKALRSLRPEDWPVRDRVSTLPGEESGDER